MNLVRLLVVGLLCLLCLVVDVLIGVRQLFDGWLPVGVFLLICSCFVFVDRLVD